MHYSFGLSLGDTPSGMKGLLYLCAQESQLDSWWTQEIISGIESQSAMYNVSTLPTVLSLGLLFLGKECFVFIWEP